LIAFSAYGWLFEQRQAWSGAPGRQLTTFTSPGVSGLKGFNFIDDRLREEADSMDLDNALVMVNNCVQWWCFGSVFWMNSPSLDGNVVWAELQNGDDDLKLLERFPDRELYVADYTSGVIRSTSRSALISQVEAAIAAKGDVADVDESTPAERDQQRREDLALVKDVLESWGEASGSFPSTNGDVQTLCAYRTLDVGCVLQTAAPDLPNDPLGEPVRYGYWWRSDGETFVVIAVQETTDQTTGCPEGQAESGDDLGRYCVQGSLE